VVSPLAEKEGEVMTEPYYLVFDCETSGVDVFNDRIVQFVMSLADREGNILNTREWVINPGVPVPKDASDIHGYTDEYLEEYGRTPVGALFEIVYEFETWKHLVVVAYNLNFDLSMLVAEIDRHLGDGDSFWMGLKDSHFFDPLVADRGFDRYRKGKRKLVNVAEHYAIVGDEDNFHNALFDVDITAKVAAAVEKKFGLPSVEEQKEMHAVWAESTEAYLRRVKEDDTITVERDWPLRLKEEES
jgi:DNA polymerase III subunit epsilon